MSLWQGFLNVHEPMSWWQGFLNVREPMSWWQGFSSSLSYMTLMCCIKIQESKAFETETLLFHAGERKAQPTFGCYNAATTAIVLGTYHQDWRTVYMTTPSRAKCRTTNRPTPRRHGRRARSAPRKRRRGRRARSKKRRYRPLSTAPSTEWRSTSGRTDHSPGTTRWAGRRLLAPRCSSGVRVRQAIVLPIATRRPSQGSIRLRLGERQATPAPPTITAGYAHQRRGALCTQGVPGPASAVLL